MKKLIMLLGVILISTNAYAGHAFDVNNYYDETNFYDASKDDIGAKADAPYLIKIGEDWFIGGEAGKDLYHAKSDEGWFFYGKITYTGTLLDFSKKK